MSTIRMKDAAQSIGEEPERRGDERSEAPRSGGSFPIEPAGRPVAPGRSSALSYCATGDPRWVIVSPQPVA